MVPQGYPLFAVVKMSEMIARVGVVVGWTETETMGTCPVVADLHRSNVRARLVSMKLLGLYTDELRAAKAADDWERDQSHN